MPPPLSCDQLKNISRHCQESPRGQSCASLLLAGANTLPRLLREGPSFLCRSLELDPGTPLRQVEDVNKHPFPHSTPTGLGVWILRTSTHHMVLSQPFFHKAHRKAKLADWKWAGGVVCTPRLVSAQAEMEAAVQTPEGWHRQRVVFPRLWSAGEISTTDSSQCRQFLGTAAAAAKSRQSCPTLCDPHRRQPTRLPCPWDSPGKNTGVGCHFLLQCTKVKSESEVAQSCPTLRDPWTAAYQAPPSMRFPRQQYWSGVPLPSPFRH